MKHLKKYEKIDVVDIANVLENILLEWDDKLILDNMEFSRTGKIIMKIYKIFDAETYKDFRNFFDKLTKLGLNFEYNNVNLTIDYTSYNKEEMELLIQTNKFNL